MDSSAVSGEAVLRDMAPSAFSGVIGISRVEITPPVGIYSRNWGAARHDVASSIHRELIFNVLTLQETPNSRPLILLDADLGFWREHTLMQAVLDGIQSDHQVGPERVLFTLSHTHAGPRIVDTVPEGAEGGEVLKIWMQNLVRTARQAVHQALQGAEEGILDWHYGSCHLAANRDLREPGSARRVCGYVPGTPADATLLVGRISDPAGNLKGVIVNYACHPTTLAFDNHSISPDFLGAMRETISTHCKNAVPFFLQGASGELAPAYQYVGDPAVADRHGRQLAYAALATLEDMEPPGTVLKYCGVVESGAALAVWKPAPYSISRTLHAVISHVELQLRNLPTSLEIQQQLAGCKDRVLAERLYRKFDVRQKVGEGTTFSLPIHGWKIGSAVLVGSMGEAYSDFQTEIRAQFPEQQIICLNLVNGCIGYLAPQHLYDEDIYQVWQSPFERQSLERTISGAISLVRQLNTLE